MSDLTELLQRPEGDPCLGLNDEDFATFRWWLKLDLLEMHVTSISHLVTDQPWHQCPDTVTHPMPSWSYRFKR